MKAFFRKEQRVGFCPIQGFIVASQFQLAYHQDEYLFHTILLLLSLFDTDFYLCIDIRVVMTSSLDNCKRGF